jgi:hypothetical protein
MEKLPIELNGDWTYNIKLPKLNTVAWHYSDSDPASNENLEFELRIDDELSDDPDPTPEQLNTIKYIFEHQEELLSAICRRAVEEIPNVMDSYDIDEDELEIYNSMDEVKIQKLISISDIVISNSYKDGFAYFSMDGSVNWEEEHGLSVHLHKDRVIYFDYWTDYIDAEKDGGVRRELLDSDVKIYTPHPKYNKLKPSQEEMNKNYVATLISRGMNEQYVRDVSKGIIDMNARLYIGNFTHLEFACRNRNYELIKYLLSQKVPIGRAMHHCFYSGSIDKTTVELLLQAGADINFNDHLSTGRTLLHFKANALLDPFRSRHAFNLDKREDEVAKEDVKIDLIKQDLAYLIQLGGDIEIKDNEGKTCYDMLDKLSVADRTTLTDWIRALHERVNNPKTSNTVEQKMEEAPSPNSEVTKPWWKRLFG